MTDELRNSAILMRRGSWVAPELFERAADEIERLTKALEHCTDPAGPGPSCAAYALEIDRLTARVAELEAPQEKWPIIDVRDGYQLGACPLCGTEHVVGDAEVASEAN